MGDFYEMFYEAALHDNNGDGMGVTLAATGHGTPGDLPRPPVRQCPEAPLQP